MSKAAEETEEQMPSWREAFLYFLFLGFVSVGGPVAQITMMFNHMVVWARLDVACVPIAAIVGGIVYSLTGFT